MREGEEGREGGREGEEGREREETSMKNLKIFYIISGAGEGACDYYRFNGYQILVLVHQMHAQITRTCSSIAVIICMTPCLNFTVYVMLMRSYMLPRWPDEFLIRSERLTRVER